MRNSGRAFKGRYLVDGLKIDEERMEWYERIRSVESAKGADSKRGIANRTRLDKGPLFTKVTYRKPARSRDHRICDFSGGFGRDSHTCYNDLQAKNRRTLERDNNWYPRSLKAFLKRGKEADAWFKKALTGKLNEGCGQSTVEYALISAAFISVVIGLGMLANLLNDGTFVSHAISAGSHGVSDVIGGAVDVFSF